MGIQFARKTAIAPTAPVESTKAQPQRQKERLVARWLRDENNRLYCQWVTEETDNADTLLSLFQ
jgi:hypothetical protein